MLRIALAILVLAPALLQDDGKKQDPNRREREILARIQKIEGQLSKTEDEDERARLSKDLDKARAELEQVRASMKEKDPVEKKGRVDVEELRRRVAELQGHIRDLRDKMERTDDAKTRDSIANDCRKCEGELERVQNQLRAVEKKGRPEDVENQRELQAQANMLREKLAGMDKNTPEFKEVYGRLQEVEGRLREMGRRPPGPDKPMDPPPPGRDVDMERALQFAREFEPGTHRKLDQLIREKRHDEAMRLARDVMPRAQQMEELKATNPDAFKRQQDIASAERDAWTLSDKLRKSEGDDRERMRGELLKSLGRLFEMRESARLKELEDLEKRVADLKSMLRKRQENKDKIIEKRAQEMVGEEFEW